MAAGAFVQNTAVLTALKGRLDEYHKRALGLCSHYLQTHHDLSGVQVFSGSAQVSSLASATEIGRIVGKINTTFNLLNEQLGTNVIKADNHNGEYSALVARAPGSSGSYPNGVTFG